LQLEDGPKHLRGSRGKRASLGAGWVEGKAETFSLMDARAEGSSTYELGAHSDMGDRQCSDEAEENRCVLAVQ